MSEGMPGATALVLAGSRGPGDPVAAAAGLSHKALVPVAGKPMLVRVVETLAACPEVGRILVMIERPEAVDALPGLAAWRAAGRLSVMPAEPSPSLSVLAALDRVPSTLPLLVTTADHPLLTAAMVRHFWESLPAGCDAAVALARAETIQAAYPETRRTYLRFAEDRVSGCNLFAFRTPRARSVAAFWRRIEQDRKRPLRMISALGPSAVLRFALGRLTLDDALARLGTLTGARLGWVDMPFAEASIDVDKPADLDLATRILERRVASGA